MQLNGIGSEHSAEVHHVTTCLHNHGTDFHKAGGAGPLSSGMSMQAVQPAEQEREVQFSLSAWLDRTLGSGKRLLGRIWNGNEIAASGEPGNKLGEAQIMAQIRDDSVTAETGANGSGQTNHQANVPPDIRQTIHTPQIAAAATAVVQPQSIQDNPYFSTVQDSGNRQETVWQRVRVKFRDMAGRLAGHLPGKFFGAQAGSFFQAKQEKPKEDMRRHSRFRKDEAEIDCILTDDSYLLDSYDRKGEYSRLSARK